MIGEMRDPPIRTIVVSLRERQGRERQGMELSNWGGDPPPIGVTMPMPIGMSPGVASCTPRPLHLASSPQSRSGVACPPLAGLRARNSSRSWSRLEALFRWGVSGSLQAAEAVSVGGGLALGAGLACWVWGGHDGAPERFMAFARAAMRLEFSRAARTLQGQARVQC